MTDIDKKLDELLCKINEFVQDEDMPEVQRLVQAYCAQCDKNKLTLLNDLYAKTEDYEPPQTLARAETYWNDGFYRGQLRALEHVCGEVFGISGDYLAQLSRHLKDNGGEK